MASHLTQRIIFLFFTVAAGGCASGTLGKVPTTDALPKELTPEMRHRFEVMDQSSSPQPLLSVAATPGPLAMESGKKSSRRKGKHHRKTPAEAKTAGAAGLKYPSLRPEKEPIWVGEKMGYSVSYFAVEAGRFTLEALPHKSISGREVYHIRGTAVTSQLFNLFYRLNDVVETFIDFNGFYSHRFHIILDESKQARDGLEIYDSEKGETFYWNRWNHRVNGYTESKELSPMPRFPQDSVSVLYYLRAVPLPDGAVLTIPVASEGKSWEAVVTVLRREEVNSVLGRVRAIVLKPETRYQGVLKKQGDSFLWLTDDDRRIPLRLDAKVKVGTVVARLTNYEPGTQPTTPAGAAAPTGANALPSLPVLPDVKGSPISSLNLRTQGSFH